MKSYELPINSRFWKEPIDSATGTTDYVIEKNANQKFNLKLPPAQTHLTFQVLLEGIF